LVVGCAVAVQLVTAPGKSRTKISRLIFRAFFVAEICRIVRSMIDVSSGLFPADEMPIHHVVDRIEELNRALAQFWKAADGWAPLEAAGLLSKSRLDWQVSLSSSLRLWLRGGLEPLSDGELILAWTNLGSLIEGTLKLFLSVYYNTFRNDVKNLKASDAYDHKKQTSKSPDGLSLEPLKKYAKARDLIGADGDALVQLVQDRRNAIHAFKDRPIGDGAEFQAALRSYLRMLEAVDDRLPYP
jgi:hypothetical protein